MEHIKIIKEKITAEQLKQIAQEFYGDMVKIVVDVEQKIMAAGGELHADEESLLLEQGSKQENLWGANVYFDRSKDSWLEYNSMINIKPRQGNSSRTIQDENIKIRVSEIFNSMIE